MKIELELKQFSTPGGNDAATVPTGLKATHGGQVLPLLAEHRAQCIYRSGGISRTVSGVDYLPSMRPFRRLEGLL